MRIWAYCTIRNVRSVRAAVGVEPLTSPPCTQESLKGLDMKGYDLLYFRLHGHESLPDVWFGETEDGSLIPAFSIDSLAGVSLDGAVVVLANCYGIDSPVIPQLLQIGASAVIAGPGENYAARSGRVVGADKLVQFIIKGLRRGWGARAALNFAKSRLLVTSWRAADRDALEFTLVRG